MKRASENYYYELGVYETYLMIWSEQHSRVINNETYREDFEHREILRWVMAKINE